MMTSNLIFYTNPMSRGRTVRWMLEELGVAYETRLLDYGPAMKDPAYRAINPMGKVPAIVHGGVVVTEQAAICTYLADAFPEARLAPPPHDPARGSYYRWLFFSAGPMEQALLNRAFGFDLPPGPNGSGRAGYGSYADVLDVLESVLAGTSYLVGDSFSTADLHMSAHLGFALMTGNIEKRPAFVTYANTHLSRPAAVRARAIDDALLAAKA
jgi:glutathione S-transferase